MVLNNCVGKYNAGIRISCSIGMCLSIYAYTVETNLEHNKNYVPMCDINHHISCSRAFSSEYGKGFGLVELIFGSDSGINTPNGTIGILFYTLCFFLSYNNTKVSTYFLFLLGFLSNCVSVYLASILYFVLYDACIVCISTYFANVAILVFAYYKVKLYRSKNKVR